MIGPLPSTSTAAGLALFLGLVALATVAVVWGRFRRVEVPVNLPGWTCPGLDRVAEIVRRHVHGPDRFDALLDLERLRLAHVRLRAAACGREPAPDEIERLEAKIRHLEALADPQEEP